MSFPIVIEKIVHFRPAAGVQQIVFSYLVINYLKHGPVEIGVDIIPHSQPQGFVAVDGDAWGEKFFRMSVCLRKKINYLTACGINDCDCLPGGYGNAFSAAGRYDVFLLHLTPSFSKTEQSAFNNPIIL